MSKRKRLAELRNKKSNIKEEVTVAGTDPYELRERQKRYGVNKPHELDEKSPFKEDGLKAYIEREYLPPKGMTSSAEVETRTRIVLASIGEPVTDENVRLAVSFMRDQIDVLTSTVTEEKARRKLQRDLRKHLHRERASKQMHSTMAFQDSLNNLDRLAKPATELRRNGAVYDDVSEADIQDIAKLLSKGVNLQKPQGTSVHHFLDHLSQNVTPTANTAVWEFFKNEFQSFVIEHDWAKAFEGVKDFDGGDIRMPFAFTCFEFRISGIRILAFLGESTDGKIEGILASGVNKRWYINPNRVIFDGNKLHHPDDTEELQPQIADYLKILGDQIRAICIMLDAKVAVGEVQRAGEGLQKRRYKEGKAPLRDYHVVSLAKRLRGNHERGEPTGIHKRLHWRRGHWRHFGTPGGVVKYINADGITVSKTWINWQLVGDEHLGFVDKHYKL